MTSRCVRGTLFIPARSEDVDENVPFKIALQGVLPQNVKKSIARNRSRAFVIVIDTSGSMSGNPMEIIKKSLLDFVSFAIRDPQITVHVVLFGSNVCDFRLSQSDEALNEIQRHFRCLGGTDYHLASQRFVPACEALLEENSQRDITLVFCSDGQVGSGNAQAAQGRWMTFVNDKYMKHFSTPPHVLALGIGGYHNADVLQNFICPSGNGEYRKAASEYSISRAFHQLLGSAIACETTRLPVEFPVSLRRNVFRDEHGSSHHDVLVDRDRIDEILWVNRDQLHSGKMQFQCNGESIEVDTVVVDQHDRLLDEIVRPFYRAFVAGGIDDLASASGLACLQRKAQEMKNKLEQLSSSVDESTLRIVSALIAKIKQSSDDRYQSVRKDIRSAHCQIRPRRVHEQEIEARYEAWRRQRDEEQRAYDRELAESERKRMEEEQKRQREAREAARKAEAERVAKQDKWQQQRNEAGRIWLALLEAEQEQARIAAEQLRRMEEKQRELENCKNSQKRVELIEALEKSRQTLREQEIREEELRAKRERAELQDRLRLAEEKRIRVELERKERETCEALLDAILAEQLRSQNSEIRERAIAERERQMDILRAAQEAERRSRELERQKQRELIGQSVLAMLSEQEIAVKLEEERARQVREKEIEERSRSMSIARINLMSVQEREQEAERAHQEEIETKEREEAQKNLDEKLIVAEQERVRLLQLRAREEEEKRKIEEEQTEQQRVHMSSSRLIAEEELLQQRESARQAEEAARLLEENRLMAQRQEKNELVVEQLTREELERRKLEEDKRTEEIARLESELEKLSEAREIKFKSAKEERRNAQKREELEKQLAQQQRQVEMAERRQRAEEEIRQRQQEKALAEKEKQDKMEAEIELKLEEKSHIRLKLEEERAASKVEEQHAEREAQESLRLERERQGQIAAEMLEEQTIRKKQLDETLKKEKEQLQQTHQRRKSMTFLSAFDVAELQKLQTRSREEEQLQNEEQKRQQEAIERQKNLGEKLANRERENAERLAQQEQEKQTELERARADKSCERLVADRQREIEQKARLEERLQSASSTVVDSARNVFHVHNAYQTREMIVAERETLIGALRESLKFQDLAELFELVSPLASVSNYAFESNDEALTQTFDGIFLNVVLERLIPGCLDIRAIHVDAVTNVLTNALVLENVQLFLGTCDAHKIDICPKFETTDWLRAEKHCSFLKAILIALNNFETTPRRQPSVIESKEPEERRKIADSDEFVTWLNSLEIVRNEIFDLSHDLSDSVVLLKLIDEIQPGIVKWKKIRKNAKNRIFKMNNASIFVECCARCGIKVIGFASDDVVNGNIKFLQSVLSQIRKKLPHSIAAMEMEKVSENVHDEEKDSRVELILIHKANELLRSRSKTFRVHDIQTGDEDCLANGLYYLDLIRCVDCHAVEAAHVCTTVPTSLTIGTRTKLSRSRIVSGIGVRKELADCFKNLLYCVSVIRRLGGRIEKTVEDLLRRKPQAVESLLKVILDLEGR